MTRRVNFAWHDAKKKIISFGFYFFLIFFIIIITIIIIIVIIINFLFSSSQKIFVSLPPFSDFIFLKIPGVGSGLLRVLWVDKNANANLVPVDMVVNALLCSAWDVANNKNTSENYNKKKLYEKMDSKENSEIIAEK